MDHYISPIYYSPHEEYVQRVVSVLASSLSITAGLIAIYLYISMRVKVFRHQLILLLLLADFGKAFVLLWYPARVLSVPSSYNNANFCDVVGFFASTFIEGADFAVLTLAVHIALLVFTRSSGPEGGLFPYRYWVYGFHIVIPLIMASLAFFTYGKYSYVPLVTWCYLPIEPTWARFFLSWTPRYIIIISIIAIYLSIYIYVKVGYSKVVKEFKQAQNQIPNPSPRDFNSSDTDDDLAGHDFTADILGSVDSETQSQNGEVEEKIASRITTDEAPNFIAQQSRTCQSFGKMCIQFARVVVRSLLAFFSYFPGFGFLAPNRYIFGNLEDTPVDETTAIVRDFQRESMANFQMRRNAIERQIRSIFVYPAAYIFLWMAPFAIHIIQYRFHSPRNGIYWIGVIAAFMQPFNCVVDTIAFCIREKPWIDRKEKIFTTENKEYIQYQLSSTFPCIPCPTSYKVHIPPESNAQSFDEDIRGMYSYSLGRNNDHNEGPRTSQKELQEPSLKYNKNSTRSDSDNTLLNEVPNMIDKKKFMSSPASNPALGQSTSDSHLARTISGMTDTTCHTPVDHYSTTMTNRHKDPSFLPISQRSSSSTNLDISHCLLITPPPLRHSSSLIDISNTANKSMKYSHPSSLSLNSMDANQATYQPRHAFNNNLPLAPPVPDNPKYRSRSPNRHCQRIVQKKAIQAAQHGSEQTSSPTPLRNVFNKRAKNNESSSKSGPKNENDRKPSSTVPNQKPLVPKKHDPQNSGFDEKVFGSTTARPVKLDKLMKSFKGKKAIDKSGLVSPVSAKESKRNKNLKFNDHINNNDNNNDDDDDDDDGVEIDLLEFLR